MSTSFFSSSACLIIETTQTKHRNRNNPNEQHSRVPRARASCKHFATVHPARLRAPAPHHSIRIEILYNNTKSILQPFTRPPKRLFKRLQNALDVRRNASQETNCGRFLLRHDSQITIHKYYTVIMVRGNCPAIYQDVKQEKHSKNPLRNAHAERLLRELFPA